MSAAEITLIEPAGVRSVVELEPVLCFQMKGIGYTHAEWGHGMWKGELAIGGESWRLDQLDPMAFDTQHVQQVMKARCGNEEGIGILEQSASARTPPMASRDFSIRRKSRGGREGNGLKPGRSHRSPVLSRRFPLP